MRYAKKLVDQNQPAQLSMGHSVLGLNLNLEKNITYSNHFKIRNNFKIWNNYGWTPGDTYISDLMFWGYSCMIGVTEGNCVNSEPGDFDNSRPRQTILRAIPTTECEK